MTVCFSSPRQKPGSRLIEASPPRNSILLSSSPCLDQEFYILDDLRSLLACLVLTVIAVRLLFVFVTDGTTSSWKRCRIMGLERKEKKTGIYRLRCIVGFVYLRCCFFSLNFSVWRGPRTLRFGLWGPWRMGYGVTHGRGWMCNWYVDGDWLHGWIGWKVISAWVDSNCALFNQA